MPTINLPPHLISEIESGNVVLMLGAGASLAATNARKQHPPTAKGLGEAIVNKFLPKDKGYEKKPLNQIAEYAISETDLFTLQSFIFDIFDSFDATPSHRLMSTFRWRGIATTNYDTLIEKAYHSEKKTAAQKLTSFIGNADRIDDSSRSREDLLLIKLHGCITHIKDITCPLILSTDQYVSYKQGRSRLFATFKEWASGKSVMFVGYGLQDQNLRQIIHEIDTEVPSRPRYYLISPGIEEIDIRLWEKKKITAISGTFDDLMQSLDEQIGSLLRGVVKIPDTGMMAIKSRFARTDSSLSRNASLFLSNDVDYVKDIIATDHIDPKLFYKGVNSGWSPIEQNLDVPRHLMDTILVDHFLENPSPDDVHVKLLVVKAHAGAGKSLLLKRLAWEAAKTYNKLCLYVKSSGVLNAAAIVEIAELTHETVFVFIDEILDRRREIESFFAMSTACKGNVTFVSTVRMNEWNQARETLTSLSTEEYDLPYLSKTEIDKLLSLLETHRALGTLESQTPDQRRESLHEKAGRQLLVALHEATFGDTFENIILDEYNRITPDRAKEIYLSVCLLNQFGVVVRAGMIARRYDLPFQQFMDEFFEPLEEIIMIGHDKASNDNCYQARHPHIAEMVVRNVLRRQNDLLKEIKETLTYLNLSYSSDTIVFRRILQGRTLLDQFSDHELVGGIYEAARGMAPEDPFLLQQMAIFEMHRPGGSLQLADNLTKKALAISNNNKPILHTVAELKIKQSEQAFHPLEKNKILAEAEKLCSDLKRFGSESFPYYTLVKIGTLRLKWALQEDPIQDDWVAGLIKSTEKHLTDGKRKFPENFHFLTAEAALARTLSNSDRFVKSLQQAFDLNNKNTIVALRLVSCYLERDRSDEAIVILKKALDVKPFDHALHFEFAKILFYGAGRDTPEVLYHLERSYVHGDNNTEAHFLHARQLFVLGKIEESKALFNRLRRAKVSQNIKQKLQHSLEEKFLGTIIRFEASYFWVKRDKDAVWIYAHRSNVTPEVWNELSYGTRISFYISFSMNGPSATGVARF